jgi:hypothetical protein
LGTINGGEQQRLRDQSEYEWDKIGSSTGRQSSVIIDDKFEAENCQME